MHPYPGGQEWVECGQIPVEVHLRRAGVRGEVCAPRQKIAFPCGKHSGFRLCDTLVGTSQGRVKYPG
jgi:hypothetical protein